MTSSDETRSGAQAWVQIHAGRPGYVMAFAGLCAGTLVYFAGVPAAARGVLAAVFALIIALPAVNVIAILVEETRRREWIFVAMAAAVLGLIGSRLF